MSDLLERNSVSQTMPVLQGWSADVVFGGR